MVYDSLFNDIFDSFFDDSFDSRFGSSYKIPRIIKSMTDNSFPQSNVYINKDTKEQKITVCLPGISEKEVRLDRDDNVITLSVAKKVHEDSAWVEIQSGFSSPEKCKLSWKIDPAKYDLDNISVDLKDGMMTITIQPTEVAKPKRVTGLFGSLSDNKTTKLEDKSKEKED